jgi:hypothetical protein
MPGIALRHPPTPPDVRVSRIRRLNAASIFMGKQDQMASRIHSASTPRCSAPSANSDWPRCATPLSNCAPLSASVRSVPGVAVCAASRASCPTVAKSSFECVAVSIPPVRRCCGVPRPGGNSTFASFFSRQVKPCRKLCPAVSPISNRQASEQLEIVCVLNAHAGWKHCDTAGWKPALRPARGPRGYGPQTFFHV